MMYDHIKPIIASSLQDDAPSEALFQARDIFETVFTAAQKSGHVLKIMTSSAGERQWLLEVLKQNNINDEITFISLLGCADQLLNTPGKDNFFQARCLFRIMLNAL